MQSQLDRSDFVLGKLEKWITKAKRMPPGQGLKESQHVNTSTGVLTLLEGWLVGFGDRSLYIRCEDLENVQGFTQFIPINPNDEHKLYAHEAVALQYQGDAVMKAAMRNTRKAAYAAKTLTMTTTPSTTTLPATDLQATTTATHYGNVPPTLPSTTTLPAPDRLDPCGVQPAWPVGLSPEQEQEVMAAAQNISLPDGETFDSLCSQAEGFLRETEAKWQAATNAESLREIEAKLQGTKIMETGLEAHPKPVKRKAPRKGRQSKIPYAPKLTNTNTQNK